MRRRIEHDYREIKGRSQPGPLEGRSWIGWRWHVTLEEGGLHPTPAHPRPLRRQAPTRTCELQAVLAVWTGHAVADYGPTQSAEIRNGASLFVDLLRTWR